jgi:hypothetical protein
MTGIETLQRHCDGTAVTSSDNMTTWDTFIHVMSGREGLWDGVRERGCALRPLPLRGSSCGPLYNGVVTHSSCVTPPAPASMLHWLNNLPCVKQIQMAQGSILGQTVQSRARAVHVRCLS